MNTGVVIPVGGGREANLERVLLSIARGLVIPRQVVLVFDGTPIGPYMEALAPVHDHLKIEVVELPKHEPGMDQPRNVGVRTLDELGVFSHVWFLDSDCVVEAHTLMAFEWALGQAEDRVLAGRYDWLAPGAATHLDGLEMVDPREKSFEAHPSSQVFKGDLSAGLACFSGNLLWPKERFERIGGFWNEIHHGRCEDGELGLRAVQLGVPISYCGVANAWHLWHERNVAWAMEANARDVPMLNKRHPWVEKRCSCGDPEENHMHVEGKGRVGSCRYCDCEEFEPAIFAVEEDGARFNAHCSVPGCDWSGNTLDIWNHEATHPL